YDTLFYQGGPGLEGGMRIFYKAATAAILNSCADIDAYSYDDYLEVAQPAFEENTRGAFIHAETILDAWNNLGCPLN
ncbi:MAG: hypothetical protein LUO93_11245, partial [Methanomicrobiales archaeon]|nr:hypothetical protein [Methanomicrobiales archaeon]MDD1679743.1 hypothetical protein [Methanomicrobiales archaeon]